MRLPALGWASLGAALVFACGGPEPAPEADETRATSSAPAPLRPAAETIEEVFALVLPRVPERLPLRTKLVRLADVCVRQGVLGPEDAPLSSEEMALVLRPAGRDGLSLIHLVARAKGSRADACIQFLTVHGADVDRRDDQGRTALLHAVENRLRPNALGLLAAGATPDLQDDLGRTALMYAVVGVKDLIGPLLDAGADPTLTTYDQIPGWRPRDRPVSALDLAAARSNRYALDMFGYDADYRPPEAQPPAPPPPPASTEELLEAARKRYDGGGRRDR